MNVKVVALLLSVLLRVISVKCVCDDYLTCLSSFFGDFFKEKDKPPTLDSVIARNSESRNIDVDAKELDQILHDVSDFVKEELNVKPIMDLKSTLFRQIYNQTTIYIKTFDISDDYLEHGVSEKQTYLNTSSNVSDKFVTVNPVSLTDLNTLNRNIIVSTEEISIVTPVSNNTVDGVSVQSLSTTESLKLNIINDERENEIRTDSNLYYDNEDNATDYPILDYIEFYKDTTNEYVNLEPTIEPNTSKNDISSDTNPPLRNTIINSTLANRTKGYASDINEEISSSVFPWVAAIFVKNSTSDQFNYYCDGALLSDTAVLTAARCLRANDSAVETDDLIVLFGKTSLTTVKDSEKVARIKSIKIHEEFSARPQGNDLAIVITEEPVTFTDDIQAATLGKELKEGQMATTGWAITGELTPILLEKKGKVACGEEATSEDTVCTVYGNGITVCPSYGGLYVTKVDTWYLQGVRTGDPEDRGLCINKNIAFTSLNSHWEWIKVNMK